MGNWLICSIRVDLRISLQCSGLRRFYSRGTAERWPATICQLSFLRAKMTVNLSSRFSPDFCAPRAVTTAVSPNTRALRSEALIERPPARVPSSGITSSLKTVFPIALVPWKSSAIIRCSVARSCRSSASSQSRVNLRTACSMATLEPAGLAGVCGNAETAATVSSAITRNGFRMVAPPD